MLKKVNLLFLLVLKFLLNTIFMKQFLLIKFYEKNRKSLYLFKKIGKMFYKTIVIVF